MVQQPKSVHKIQAAVFDMDGLLVDTEPLWRQAEMEVFGRLGIELTDEMAMDSTGIRIDEVVKSRLTDKTTDPGVLKEVKWSILYKVDELLKQRGRMLPGAMALLHAFAQLNLPMALASSSPPFIINAVISRFELNNYFLFWRSAEDELHGKPHPAVYLKTCAQLNLNPMHCLAFEDSVPGAQAAIAANMPLVAVPAESEYDRIEFRAADLVLRSLADFDFTCFSFDVH